MAAGKPPKNTVVAPAVVLEKPSPLIVTSVPPAAAALSGTRVFVESPSRNRKASARAAVPFALLCRSLCLGALLERLAELLKRLARPLLPVPLRGGPRRGPGPVLPVRFSRF